MFAKQKSINGQVSASMLHNNLAVNFKSAKNSLLFVHKSAAHLLCKADAVKDFPDCEVTADGHIHRDVVCKVPSANQQISYVLILQADWVELTHGNMLVLATQKGIKMYDELGSTLIHWHGFGAGGESIVFTKGITSVGGQTICIGSSSGQIIAFSVSARGEIVKFEEYVAGHKHSITAVAAEGDKLVSADENGDIVIHRHVDGTSFKLEHTVPGRGIPCNTLAVWKNLIVAGYSNGELRLYSLSNGILLGVIDAHALSINAVHIAKDSGRCVSVSEDSYVRVWEFQSGSSLEVSHLFAESITDHQLVGARFLDAAGTSFAVTAYDSSEIFVFNQP